MDAAPDPDPGHKVEVVWRAVLRTLLLVQVGLLIASMGVPLLGYNHDPSFDEDRTLAGIQTLTLWQGISYFGDRERHFLGATEQPSHAVSLGRTLTVTGLLVMLVLLIGVFVLVLVLALATDHQGRALPAVTVVAGLALGLSVLVVVLGQRLIDNDDFATRLQPALFVPAGAAVWLLSIAYHRSRWG